MPLAPLNSVICPSPPNYSLIGVIVVGCAVAAILIIFSAYFFLRSRRSEEKDSEGSTSQDTENRVAILEQKLLKLERTVPDLRNKLSELETMTVPDLQNKVAKLEAGNAGRNRLASDGSISLSPTTTHLHFPDSHRHVPENGISPPEPGNKPSNLTLQELGTDAVEQNQYVEP